MTKQELEAIGLDNLIGTSVLRAYMHGYFIDIRLYKKAKLINEPFNFDEFKQRKIKERLDKEKENRVRVVRKLPAVNTELAKRLIEEKDAEKAKTAAAKKSTNIMEDKRFAELFTDPNFQINTESEEFKLLNPVVQKVNEKKLKKKTAHKLTNEVKFSDDEEGDGEEEEKDGNENASDSSSSDDEHEWKQTMKEQYKKVRAEARAKERAEKMSPASNRSTSAAAEKKANEPKFFELKEGVEYFGAGGKNSRGNAASDIIRNEKLKKLPLLSRLKHTNAQQEANEADQDTVVFRSESMGNKQMTFLGKRVSQQTSVGVWRFFFVSTNLD